MEPVTPTTNKDIKNIMHGSTQGLEQRMDEFTESIRSEIADEKQRLQKLSLELAEIARQKVKRATEDSTEFVRQHPLGAVCGATAVGLLAGLILSRRH